MIYGYIRVSSDKQTVEQGVDLSHIAKELNVSHYRLRSYLVECGLMVRQPKHWTAEEESFLRDNYPSSSAKEIAAKLGRSANSVKHYAFKLNLKK